MASVVVTIAGRTYRMSCEDGQESHLERLAREVDERMGDLRRSFGEIGEQRLVVMTALTVADELDGLRRRLEELEQAAQAARTDAERAREEGAERIAELEAAVERTADRVERIAGLLSARP